MPSVEFRFAFHRGCINACLDLTVQVTRILLDTAAKAKLSLDMSRRLLKGRCIRVGAATPVGNLLRPYCWMCTLLPCWDGPCCQH